MSVRAASGCEPKARTQATRLSKRLNGPRGYQWQWQRQIVDLSSPRRHFVIRVQRLGNGRDRRGCVCNLP
jgi:hypothetical protein